ncbi:hypothetical protein NX821_002544 [Clostridium septicum]|uniref:hypothetical protein n=1 Tax=Clostridium septicum TaxID=1504 RepID=UPI003216C156
MFNWEVNLPNIGWFSMSIKEYLILMIILFYLCIFIFIFIAFVIGRFIKNSYIAFVACCILNGVYLIIPSLSPGNSKIIIYSTFTPFNLVYNPICRFMNSGALTMFKYYEGITIIVWSVLMVGFMYYSIKTFKKECIS